MPLWKKFRLWGWSKESQDNIAMVNFAERDSQQDVESQRINDDAIKFIKKWTSIIVFAVTGFYLVSMSLIQVNGLDITGLEVCNINQTLISSKTGYLREWWNQEIAPLKQLALV